jgi:hypothetical protein
MNDQLHMALYLIYCPFRAFEPAGDRGIADEEDQ